MKKVLTNIILLFTFSISGMAQIEYGKTVEISKEVLLFTKSVSMPTEFSQQPIFTKVQEISN